MFGIPWNLLCFSTMCVFCSHILLLFIHKLDPAWSGQGPAKFVRNVMALAPRRRRVEAHRQTRHLTSHEKIEQRVRWPII